MLSLSVTCVPVGDFGSVGGAADGACRTKEEQHQPDDSHEFKEDLTGYIYIYIYT